MKEYLPLIAAWGIGFPLASYWELTWIGTGILCAGLCALFLLIGGH